MEETKQFIPGVTEDVNVTERAIQEIKKIKKENNIPDEFSLRIGVKGGGCSGLSYSLGFDAETSPTDNVIEKDGITVAIDMKSYLFLTGTEIDFIDGEQGRGFVFNNPNAQRTCGCGSSSC
jgi:iron-sulfur cluster assembly protein